MAENNVEKKTQELVGKIITDLGYELYDIEYLKEGKEYHLCIYIDKPEGISLNDCEIPESLEIKLESNTKKYNQNIA